MEQTKNKATLESIQETAYIHNTPVYLDIAFEDTTISITKIKSDGYEIGVNHRPIRTPHVNKIKDAYIGDSINIKVVFDSRDECYHIIQGQHIFTAYIEMLHTTKEITCGVIKHKLTGKTFDACNKEDRDMCFQYSYRNTEGQERNCLADRISMCVELSNEYKDKTGSVWGVIDYVYDRQYGSQKLTKSTIKSYVMYGKSLEKNNCLMDAQQNRWDEKQIKAKIDEYKLKKTKYKSVTLKLEPDEYQEFILRGFDDVKSWKKVLKVNNKQTIQSLLVFSKS